MRETSGRATASGDGPGGPAPDPSGGPYGRTNRRRLAVALAATTAAAAVVLGCVAEGAVAASFTSGTPFTVTVESLEAKGFGMQLGLSTGTGRPAVLTRWPVAEVSGLCQSVTVDLPIVGPTTMVLTARTVHATDLVIDAYHASGTLNLRRLVIGPTKGTTGYHSEDALLKNITLRAGSATAGTFALTGVGLDVRPGSAPCRLPNDGAGKGMRESG